MPPVAGTARGEFAVGIYAEDLPGFAGFQIRLDLPFPAFQIAFNNTPPDPDADWGDRKIIYNQDFLPEIEQFCDGETAGLLSVEREWIGFPVFDWGDYADKSIPAADEINPQTGQPYGRTWLMTIICSYGEGAADGGYIIGTDNATRFHDRDNNDLPFTMVAGSLTIGIDTAPPTPNPAAWATPPYATSPASITMTAVAAADAGSVEYYFEETSENPGGADSGWQAGRQYTNTGLDSSTTYTYKVKTRDKSADQNETAYSPARSASTEGPFTGKLIVEGPGERTEGRLTPAGAATHAEFIVDIYAENFPGFIGFQAAMNFLDHLGAEGAGFSVAYNNEPPDPEADWGDRKIIHNNEFLPLIEHTCNGQIVGLRSTEREWIGFPVFDWGDYIDKTIPAAHETNPATGRPYGRTWLMSVTYNYSADVVSGNCLIEADTAPTAFRDVDDNELPYTVVAGSLTIGWYLPGDINGDGIVNILDMIAVRNRLNQDADSGDNWQADLTGDGKINILDLIFVRNHLYTMPSSP